ncbi:hypothetical protein ACFFX1_54680 [Dactylosporangium sucinum]|uniref:Uncharacterized protein n=1 Tax=Dactylosporangium sucinum TaxID=1424081 RepID=A0A917X1W0_9ACTN|nr:hypothetical protein [Dactylosporangium sucinum]GGM53776.1 hypothetical protein GCM10007977_064220 [Dactylosporangium sucinum]
MRDLLAALRRELHEMELTAAECRANDEFLPAVIAEERAARVGASIATLESADGNAYGPPVSGAIA